MIPATIHPTPFPAAADCPMIRPAPQAARNISAGVEPMSLLSRLFGGSATPKPELKPEIYKDFRIFADPAKEGSRFRITARIEKQKVNANLYKARLVATASHPGAGSVQYKSPWQYIYKNQSPKKHNVTILAFRFSSSLRWSSNKLIGNVTASVTVLGKTVRLSRTVTATVT